MKGRNQMYLRTVNTSMNSNALNDFSIDAPNTLIFEMSKHLLKEGQHLEVYEKKPFGDFPAKPIYIIKYSTFKDVSFEHDLLLEKDILNDWNLIYKWLHGK